LLKTAVSVPIEVLQRLYVLPDQGIGCAQ
jgi:hypothetical protein